MLILRTSRMILRTIAMTDAPRVMALHADARVVAPLIDAAPTDARLCQAYVIYYRLQAEQGLPGAMVALERATGAFLGLFTMARLEDEDAVELGVRLSPAAWGRGLVTEGGAALISHGFGAIGLERIVSFTAAKNRTVPLVLAQLGFSYVRDFALFEQPARRFELTRADWNPEIFPCARRAAMARLKSWGLGHARPT